MIRSSSAFGVAMPAYLTAALEDGNSDVFLAAVGHVAKARGMTAIAERAGLGRESLYKALAPGAKPRYETVLSGGSSAPRDTHVTTGTGQRRVVSARGEAAGIGRAIAVGSAHVVARAAYPNQKDAIDALVQQFAALPAPHLAAAEAHPASYVGNTNLPEVVVGALAQSEKERREQKRLREEKRKDWWWSLIERIGLLVVGALIGWLLP